MGWDQPSHWLVLAIVVAVLFGYKKLPEASRAVGRSLRIFKTEIKGMGDDDKARDTARDPEAAAPPAVVVKQVEAAPVEDPAPVVAQPATPPAATVPSTEKPTTSAQ